MRSLGIIAVLVIASLLAVPYWLLLRPEDWQAVLVNTMWSGFNLILLTAALLVGFEQPQIRTAHRLQRHLPVIITSDNITIMGETVNISETGCLISLESWPNLPDELQIEIIGDFSARVRVTARVARLSPINDQETHLAVDFVELTREQQDGLVMVLYSDVREWYSQKRENTDRPIASLGFLATSLNRSLRDVKSSPRKKIRKQVTTSGQIYWDGNFFPGVATELGVTGLRLELEGKKALTSDRLLNQQDFKSMQNTKPLVGLVLGGNPQNDGTTRFVAEITSVKEEANGKVSIELTFPDKFQERQSPKVKELLQSL
jgi:cellulose synthase (UDP-forming)